MEYRGSSVRPSVPKPYDFVPIASSVDRKPTPGLDKILYDDAHFTGRLTFEVRTLTPVFVSNGRYALSEELGFKPGLAMRGCYRLGRRPAIPAASIKGAIRSVAEAASPSCVTITRTDLPRHLTDAGQCQIGPDDKGQPRRACPACALFGGGGTHAHIGLVRFQDVLLEPGLRTERLRLAPLYAPRVSYRRTPKVYLDARGGFKGRKFYYHGLLASVGEEEGDLCEVIPEGARLAGGLSFANLDASLLGLLLFALGLDGTFKLKLGSGKPLSLGSIEIVATELWQDTGSGLLEAARGGETLRDAALAGFIKGKIAAAEQGGRLLQVQIKKLREILRYPNSRRAPTGMY